MLTIRLLTRTRCRRRATSSADELFTDYEQMLFTRVVAIAERHGRGGEAAGACRRRTSSTRSRRPRCVCKASEIVVGESAKMLGRRPGASRSGEAWDRTPHDRDLTTRIVVYAPDGRGARVLARRARPELSSEGRRADSPAVGRRREGGRPRQVHHRDIVAAALEQPGRRLQEESGRGGRPPPRKNGKRLAGPRIPGARDGQAAGWYSSTIGRHDGILPYRHMPDAGTIQIPNRALFKSAEVCDIVKVQPYVLRTWEAEFPELGVAKVAGGPRIYRRSDVEQVVKIRHLLLVEGLTLAGARRKLEDDVSPVAADAPVLDELMGRHARERLDGSQTRTPVDSRSAGGAPGSGGVPPHGAHVRRSEPRAVAHGIVQPRQSGADAREGAGVAQRSSSKSSSRRNRDVAQPG